MIGLQPPVDPGIYLLADHLDAALAAGEDLLAAELAAPADIDRETPGSSSAAIAAFANDLKRLEASIAARVLQARRRAAELPRLDPVVRGILNLFMTSTESALDLVDHFANLREGGSFDPSNLTPYAVLRSRGLLAPDAAELPRYQTVVVSESYQIGGLLPLGSLLNVVSTTLDALDLHFDLYLDGAARAATLEASEPEPNNAATVEDAPATHEHAALEAAPAPAPEAAAVQPAPLPDTVTALEAPLPPAPQATVTETPPSIKADAATRLPLAAAPPLRPEPAEPPAAAQAMKITKAIPVAPVRKEVIVRAIPVAPAPPIPPAALPLPAAKAAEPHERKKPKTLAEALAFLEKPPASPSPSG